MRATTIVHPLLYSSLPQVYPSTCTIQEATVTVTEDGEEVSSWSNLADHVDLDCRISPPVLTGFRPTEEAGPTSEPNRQQRAISLADYYPLIEVTHRVLVGSVPWDILAAESDGQSESTRLLVERLVP